MELEFKHIGMVLGSFLSAQIIDGATDFWNKEAVWILFLVSGIVITFVKDVIDPTKKVTGMKVLWSIVVVVVVCSLLRFYKAESDMSSFWFYFWTVMVGVFSPSAVFKILQNSDDKAETAFSKIVNAFVDGIVHKINTIFGSKSDTNNEENGE